MNVCLMRPATVTLLWLYLKGETFNRGIRHVLFFLSGLSDLPFEFVAAAGLGFLAALLIGMTVHEWAHNYVAHLMGDPVPSRWGRLTLNPLVHIYWPGFIMVLLIGFGTLGTAPIAAHRMRNPRVGYMLSVAAGPVSNLVLAIIGALFFNWIGAQLQTTTDPQRMFNLVYAINFFDYPSPGILLNLQFGLYFFILLNISLFLFNLLPLAPLDGWYIIYTLLPPREAIWWERNRQNSQTVFFLLIFISYALPQFNLLSVLIREPMNVISNLLLGG